MNGVYRCIVECTDVWAIQKCGGCMEAYKHTGGHTSIQGTHRCMGHVQKYGEHTNVWGDVQMFGQYRHMG